MYGQRPITTVKLFNAQAISKAGVATSVVIDLRQVVQNGPFSIHYIMAGTGTMLIQYTLCSTRGGTYLTPSNGSNIVLAGAAGSDIVTFAPEIAPFMKIVVTENNVNPITSLDLWLNFQ